MSTLRQAAQQALEALETNNQAWKNLADSGDAGFWEAEEQPFYETSVKAITALRAALAEQPASKPWVGLTEEERTDICDGYGANIHWRAFRAIEAKLQEKNT